MLWLGIYFPELAIDALTRIGSLPLPVRQNGDQSRPEPLLTLVNSAALVVADYTKNVPSVYIVNTAARQAGIRPGTSLASARVLCHKLIVLPRDREKETILIHAIADRLTRFSPSISIHESIDRATIVLEVARSLKLFKGIDSLLERITTTALVDVGINHFGIAPTPLAAEVFSHAACRDKLKHQCLTINSLTKALASIDVSHFAWPASINRSLNTLGLKTFGDVIRQPVAGLEKRFGHSFVADIRRALGALSDVRSCYTPPDFFERHITLGFDTSNVDLLLLPVRDLLGELELFLRFRGAAVNRVFLSLRHGRSHQTHLEFSSRTATRYAARWLLLVRDRLERQALADHVFEIALRAENFVEIADKDLDLLRQNESESEHREELFDRISTRIGSGNLYRVASVSEHRPELAWHANESIKVSRKRAQKSRPLWILRTPKSLVEMDSRPQYGGALTLLAGPERIDTGWWDNKPVARDYFVATNSQHELCWIFRDYRQQKRWYLHGFFA